jgi:hypothetical protein
MKSAPIAMAIATPVNTAGVDTKGPRTTAAASATQAHRRSGSRTTRSADQIISSETSASTAYGLSSAA